MFTVFQTEEFVTWLDDLKDKRAQVRIAARLRQAESGNLGDWQPIEGEVSELRVHYGSGYSAVLRSPRPNHCRDSECR